MASYVKSIDLVHLLEIGVCNEHGTIYVISSDFGDRMTTQHLD